jgi:hypothetical protein
MVLTDMFHCLICRETMKYSIGNGGLKPNELICSALLGGLRSAEVISIITQLNTEFSGLYSLESMPLQSFYILSINKIKSENQIFACQLPSLRSKSSLASL